MQGEKPLDGPSLLCSNYNVNILEHQLVQFPCRVSSLSVTHLRVTELRRDERLAVDK